MDGPVRYVVRAQVRRRWRSLLILTVLAGVVFGAATAAGATARRTASAYSRLNHQTHGWDALYFNYVDDGSLPVPAGELASLPAVGSVHEVDFGYFSLGPGVAWLSDRTGRLGRDLARARLLEGRWFDTTSPNEVVISFALAEQEHLGVGDSFEFFPRAQVDAVAAEEPELVEALIQAFPDLRMQVTGIVAAPGQFPPIHLGVPLIQVSPAAVDVLGESNTAVLIRLADGATAADLVAAVTELDGHDGSLLVHAELARDVNRSLRPQVAALAVLAVLVAATGAVLVGQAAARQVDAEIAHSATLSAVGLTRKELRRVALLESALIGLAAAAVGMIVAVAASPLTPSGLARLADPDRGLRVDPGALVLGSSVTVAVVVIGALVATEARLRAAGVRHASPAHRMLGRSAVVAAGLRWAVHPERSRRSPVWSTLAGVVAGIAAVVTTISAGATLDHQVAAPERYGLRWDAEIVQFEDDGVARRAPSALLEDRRVDGAAVGADEPARLGGRAVRVIAMDLVRGDVRPPLVWGIYPGGPDDVALGGRTMRRLGVDIGDTVDLGFGTSTSYRVVGEVIVPVSGPGGRLDEGAFLSGAGMARAQGRAFDGFGTVFVDLAPGADLMAVVDDLSGRAAEEPPSVIRPQTPNDIVDLQRTRTLPALVAAGLALLAALALAHALLAGAWRRRSEVAVLRSMGFDRRQVRTAVLVHGMALSVASLGIGLPLGVVLGRLVWRALASEIGSPVPSQLPLVATFLVLPAVTLGIAAMLSRIASRHVLRPPPASALRAE